MFTREAIAKAYAAAPLYQLEAVDSYRALARDSVALADEICRTIKVTLVLEAEPYPTHEAMFADIDRGELKVSVANSEHSVFSLAENVAFRIVHDYLGHYAAKADFTWGGEQEACKAHAERLSPEAFPAFFTECYGQAAYAVQYGHFAPQKVALLDIF